MLLILPAIGLRDFIDQVTSTNPEMQIEMRVNIRSARLVSFCRGLSVFWLQYRPGPVWDDAPTWLQQVPVTSESIHNAIVIV